MELFNSFTVVIRGFFCHSIQCPLVHGNFQITFNRGKIRVKETKVIYSLQKKVMFFLVGTFQNRLGRPPVMSLPRSPFNEWQNQLYTSYSYTMFPLFAYRNFTKRMLVNLKLIIHQSVLSSVHFSKSRRFRLFWYFILVSLIGKTGNLSC